jgi:rare lipoprotein A
VDGRVIDVSRRGARELGLLGPGIAPVRVTVLEAPAPRRCWEVQVGAYRERENAQVALARVRGGGVEARIVEGPDGLLRVRAGPWTDRAPAEAFQRQRGGMLVGC